MKERRRRMLVVPIGQKLRLMNAIDEQMVQWECAL